MSAVLDRLAAVARWSYLHRFSALAGWLVALILSTALYVVVGVNEMSPAQGFVRESGAAEQIETSTDFLASRTETVLVDAGSGQRSADVAGALVAALDGARSVERVDGTLVARSGESRVVEVLLTEQQASPAVRVQGLQDAMAAVRAAHPGVHIDATGPVSVQADVTTTYAERLSLLEWLSLPITAVVLFLVFAGIVAAAVPLVTGLLVVVLAFLWSGVTSLVVPAEANQPSLILLMGLALGVDYSLFFVRRTREEFSRTGDVETAALTAVSATVRSVVVAGTVTAVSVAAAFLTESPIFHSLTLGIILVVVAAMLASVTLLPALLRIGGKRIVRQAFGRRAAAGADDEDAGFWSRLTAAVVRRPGPALLAGLLVLIALAAPVSVMRLQVPGTDSMPRTFPTLTTLDRIADEYPLYGVSHTAVTALDGGRDVGVDTLRRIAERAAASPGFDTRVRDVEVSVDGSVARVEIGTDAPSIDSDAAMGSLADLRDRIIPEVSGGSGVLVGGETAVSADLSAAMVSDLWIVIGIVVAVSFLLMVLAFASVPLAVLSVALNLLSVLASYGVLVVLFQFGWGAPVFGEEFAGPVVTLLPVMMLAILFGLSMDYHVFILTRVREALVGGAEVGAAIRHGAVRSAPPVTAAAAVMVVVFALFTVLPTHEMKQLGVGLAVAIALDATVVRGVLLPAALRLLGERGWRRSRPVVASTAEPVRTSHAVR
jgi:RND superfamily putative drug exporter